MQRFLFLILFVGTMEWAEIPRGADGKPNLNGIWQVNNEANWSLERQVARHAPMLQKGHHGPLPLSHCMAKAGTPRKATTSNSSRKLASIA